MPSPRRRGKEELISETWAINHLAVPAARDPYYSYRDVALRVVVEAGNLEVLDVGQVVRVVDKDEASEVDVGEVEARGGLVLAVGFKVKGVCLRVGVAAG